MTEGGCGVMGVFRRRSFWPRRPASSTSLPASEIDSSVQKVNNSYSKRRRGAFAEAAALIEQPLRVAEKFVVTQSPLMSKSTPTASRHQNSEIRQNSELVSLTSSPGSGRSSKMGIVPVAPQKHAKKASTTTTTTLSCELEGLMPHLRGQGNLLRASSSNMMVFGHLGNIKPSGHSGNSNSSNSNSDTILDYLPIPTKEKSLTASAKGGGGGLSRNAVMGNIVRRSSEREGVKETENGLCRALSRRLEPEELKELGNEEFRKGNFAEALSYYERAISLDPGKASYRSNKAAAMTGLGRLLEAVDECREATRIDPSYQRAHHRLATLYLRLGEAEKALNQYTQSGMGSNSKEIAQAQALQMHLARCNQARKLKDWQTMIKKAQFSISSGADSAPQAFYSQAEALLKLHRHQEADEALSKAPVFEYEASIKFFGVSMNAYHFLIRAQVDMATGRFEEGVVAAQRAVQLDATSREAEAVARRARAVARARSRGNELFKVGKVSEACTEYGEGLEHDPFNALLLCNRATCRSKLGQWEKAVEDCNSALNLRPSYRKALLRRADCNAKLERWEASVQDYEALMRETLGDEKVGRALFECQVQLKKQQGEDVGNIKFGSEVVVITRKDQFRHIVTSPGISVVLFVKKSRNANKQTSFLAQLCKRYPSVKFLKVEIEDNPYIVKSEGVTSLPSFYVYRNGSKVKDIEGNNLDLLENSLKIFCTS